jgi:hypothetical protein
MVRAIQEEPSIRRLSVRVSRRASIAPALRSAAVGLGPPVLLIGVLAWPLMFSSGYFNEDWMEQLWFIWKQSMAIHANHLPSLFLNYHYGLFYPHYTFYGGTLYALTGTLALALGSAPAAYVLTYLLGFAAAYGGWYWMGRMAGLGRWWVHVPALVFITSAYYLTLIYARGDWPEFIGISTIPPMIAGGLSVLRADRLRLWPAAALTASGILFFGSHSLTIVWGATVIFLVGLAILLWVPQARREVSRAGVIRVALLLIPAALVSAWFLVPAVAYESQTRIASAFTTWQRLLKDTMPLVSVDHLFTLSRASASIPGAAFALSLPILAIAWVLVGIALALRGQPRSPWTRVLLICASLTVLLTVLMAHSALILALPRIYATLQFAYRLETYVLLGLCGAVLAILALMQGAGPKTRLWRWALVPVVLVAVVGAVQQSRSYPNSGNRQSENRTAVFNSFRKLDAAGAGRLLPDYIDVDQQILTPRNGQPADVKFALAAVHDNRVSKVVHLRSGQLVYSNLFAPPDMVNIKGARIVGINEEGYDVLEIGPAAPAAATPGATRHDAAAQTETISIAPADTLPVVAGRVLTLLAIIALAAVFATIAVRERRERVRS